jgi:hypothetical protein
MPSDSDPASPARPGLRHVAAAPDRDGDPQIEVSVVIPCLNEARTIGICVEDAQTGLQRSGVIGEVVVADNGSSDGSIEIAARQGARVVHAPIKGYGSALRKGIEEARGAFIVMGDADGSHDFSEIPRFVVKWREGWEFVVGNRFRGEIKPGAMPWHHRHIGTPMLSALLSLFFRTGIRDINCGMRGITKNLFHRLDLRTTGMEFASESLIKAAKLGVPLSEVPITVRPDSRGRPPHLRTFRDGWRHLRFILLCAPNWLFLVPGCLLTVLGIGLVLWLLPGTRCVGPACFDTRTMLSGVVLALLGVHIVSIGLFAKAFSYTEKLSRNQPTFERWLKRVKLEHALILGTTLIILGLGGDGSIFWQWASSGFGRLPAIRGVISWSLCLCLGVEVVFSSFFLSMLGIARDLYIGD